MRWAYARRKGNNNLFFKISFILGHIMQSIIIFNRKEIAATFKPTKKTIHKFIPRGKIEK